MLTQGQRRIPVQMARSVMGGQGQRSTYIPLKVNFAGVMPIIFAGAILIFPGAILRAIPSETCQRLSVYFNHDTYTYIICYGVLIMIFSYFWVANMFNPLQMSNYIATVLNGGNRYSAHLLLEVRDYGEEKPIFVREAEVVDKIYLSKEALGAVKDGMKQMVEHEPVTVKYMRGLPVTVGGKTGTAQRGNGRNDNRFFVCAAPYDDPEIVVTVIIEPDDDKPKDGVHGSAYAFYAASEVLKEYYAKK
jgi:hypothetical protein